MEEEQTFDISNITDALIHQAVLKFTGKIMQSPPLHSAVKVNGKRAYEMARRGEQHVLEAKQVTVSEFEITGIELPNIFFRVVCGKGTYIRSLANDLGEKLGCGAYLSALCRTRIGNYSIKEAVLIKDFKVEDDHIRPDPA